MNDSREEALRKMIQDTSSRQLLARMYLESNAALSQESKDLHEWQIVVGRALLDYPDVDRDAIVKTVKHLQATLPEWDHRVQYAEGYTPEPLSDEDIAEREEAMAGCFTAKPLAGFTITVPEPMKYVIISTTANSIVPTITTIPK
jgi:hypothetical protein